ncbi:MAG: hypothetical protein IJ336_11195 [Lachnospiraceae bacterium]|nr:hypothetical protein [Lachnospiraceae bacterium]
MKRKSHIKINPKYYRQHNYLIYCNDILVRWLQWIDNKQLCYMTIKFKNDDEMESFKETADSDIDEWLRNNGHEYEMYELNRRHILCSLVADFCHYMLESFICASKMKPAVAYALLRKPLRDNLAYIEWLRVNPRELIDKLMYSEPKEYDLSFEKEIKKTRIEQIAKEYGINRENGMFEFRYEKNSDISLEKIWNKANHIVTTQNYTKTNNGELNFIFVNSREWEWLTEYYYTVVPLVMSYAVELIVSMFEEIGEINPFTKTINTMMLVLHQAYGMGDKYYNDAKVTLELGKCPLVCPFCGKVIDLKSETDKLMFNKFRCRRLTCRKKIDASNYIFDFENLNQYME